MKFTIPVGDVSPEKAKETLKKAMKLYKSESVENLFMPDSIRVHSGKYLNLLKMDPDTIDIEDIAHGISHQCRFGGHMQLFYSVAQHSVWCSYQAETVELAFEALMHDASEAYLVDIPTPVKRMIPDYYVIEEKLMRIICAKYEICYPMSPLIKKIDANALQFEWDNGVLSKCLEPIALPQPEAKQAFLNRFEELTHLLSVLKQTESELDTINRGILSKTFALGWNNHKLNQI
jgi:hypothetical protein